MNRGQRWVIVERKERNYSPKSILACSTDSVIPRVLDLKCLRAVLVDSVRFLVSTSEQCRLGISFDYSVVEFEICCRFAVGTGQNFRRNARVTMMLSLFGATIESNGSMSVAEKENTHIKYES